MTQTVSNSNGRSSPSSEHFRFLVWDGSDSVRTQNLASRLLQVYYREKESLGPTRQAQSAKLPPRQNHSNLAKRNDKVGDRPRILLPIRRRTRPTSVHPRQSTQQPISSTPSSIDRRAEVSGDSLIKRRERGHRRADRRTVMGGGTYRISPLTYRERIRDQYRRRRHGMDSSLTQLPLRRSRPHNSSPRLRARRATPPLDLGR